MYKLKNKIRVNSFEGLIQEEPVEGMSIEQKVQQMMDQNEPITDAVPMIYTSKEDGVKPEHDIRTNKWDYAIDAMNDVNNYKKTKYLQGEQNAGSVEEQKSQQEQKETPAETKGKQTESKG